MRGAVPGSSALAGLFEHGAATGLPDEQLLARFVGLRGASAEAAFAVIVQRHGPGVLRVCRRILGNRHEADDAFQATFLVLARRANSLQQPDRLAAWLHGVARRTARKVRAAAARRERLSREAVGRSTTTESIDPHDVERLHAEIDRLPERYRTPVVLCYLDGLSHEAAARQVGCPTSTLSVRLMRARERLRQRLERVGLTAVSLEALPRVEPPDVALVQRTVSLAIDYITRGQPKVASAGAHALFTLATGVLNAMTIQRHALQIGLIVVSALFGAGAATFAFAPPTANPPVSEAAAPDADPTPGNLLKNAGLEQADLSGKAPLAWSLKRNVPSVSLDWDRTSAHEGTASLHLKKTAQRYFPIAEWGQEIPRTGTKPRLKVSAFVKAKAMTKAILDVQFLGADNFWQHQWVAYIGSQADNDPPADHDWKKLDGVVAIPEQTQKLIISAQVYGPGDVWFDDFQAEYTDEPVTDPLRRR